jgi:uncharacterized protein
VTDILILSGFAFLAGLVDSVVGGGGLIQLPALLIVFPHTAIASLFGTNKLASIAGTSIAVVQYSRQVTIPWKTVLPGAIAAGTFSFLGAHCVQFLSPSLLRPIILVLLVVVGVYTFFRKDFGSLHQPKLNGIRSAITAIAAGAILGFYDGFFGPGTGSFLIFAFIGVLGFDFLTASASSKVLNWCTNFAALVAFASAGQVLYALALPMAGCNIVGSFVGTRLAVLKGNSFIRILFLVVISALIAKLIYDALYL